MTILFPNSISFYYEFSKELDYICTTPEDSGMHLCGDFPPYRYGPVVCNEKAKPFSYNTPTNESCVDWNQYYTNCTQRGSNPFQGTISFDNIGLAWVAIFLVSNDIFKYTLMTQLMIISPYKYIKLKYMCVITKLAPTYLFFVNVYISE